jgi:hypothetical protein
MPNSTKVSRAPSPAEGKVDMMVSGVDRALIEHVEDEVDGDQGSQDRDECAAERTLERVCAALEAGGNRGRHAKIRRGPLDR